MIVDSDTHRKNKKKWNAAAECRRYWWIYCITSALTLCITLISLHYTMKKYSSQVVIADETKEVDILIGLSSWESWLKHNSPFPDTEVDMNNILVYTKFLDSYNFIERFSQTKIPKYDTDYYHYIAKEYNHNNKEDILSEIQDNLKYEVFSRNSTAIIQVTDKNAYVAAVMVDSVTQLLQYKMIKYRKMLSNMDFRNEQNSYKSIRKQYNNSQAKYAEYLDKHQDAVDLTETSQIDSLQKERDIKFKQLQETAIKYTRAKGLSQQNIRPFSIVKEASVSLEPAFPNTTGYVSAFMVINLIITTWGILIRKNIIESTEN